MSKLIDHLDISMELWLQVIYNPITAMGFPGNVYLLHCRKKIGDVGGFQLVDLIITELKDHMTCYRPF